jgi:hypothetical protein
VLGRIPDSFPIDSASGVSVNTGVAAFITGSDITGVGSIEVLPLIAPPLSVHPATIIDTITKIAIQNETFISFVIILLDLYDI